MAEGERREAISLLFSAAIDFAVTGKIPACPAGPNI